jgi:hypothetical protein
MFIKAKKEQTKLRMALVGPSGSGKTYTALRIAKGLGGRIALLDTEHGSASKYANLFDFDCAQLMSYEVEKYIAAMKEAGEGGYDVLIIDSLSHAWAGTGGILEYVDNQTLRSNSRNAFTEGWKKATPRQNALIEAILNAPLHVIVTMRTKTAYDVEKDDKGRMNPVKIGVQPIQREGVEYEFDVLMDLNIHNEGIVTKTRCPELTGKIFYLPGEDVAEILKAWLDGAPPTPIAEKKMQEPSTKQEVKKTNGNGKSQRPLEPEALKNFLFNKYKTYASYMASVEQRNLLVFMLESLSGGNEIDRHALTRYLTGEASSKKLSGAQVKALLDWIGAEKTDSGFVPSEYAIAEAKLVLGKVMVEQGQQPLPIGEAA